MDVMTNNSGERYKRPYNMFSTSTPRRRLFTDRLPSSSLSLPLSDLRSSAVKDSLETQMQNEAENVLRDWDTSVKTQTEGTLRIRSGSVGAPDLRRSRQRSRSQASPSSSSPLNLSHPLNGSGIHFDYPEVEIIQRDSSEGRRRHGSNDAVTNRNHHYVECPATGQRLFRIELDITGFTERDISVKVDEGRLTVQGIRQEHLDGRKSTNEFCRKIKLPRDVSGDRLSCCYVNNILVIEAPTNLSSSYTESLNTSSIASAERKISLNSPTILTSSNGEKRLYLIAEVGRIFKAGDVTVRVNGQNKIIVRAERKEETGSSRMRASVDREYDLPEGIDRSTLDAGFVSNAGVLKITAKLK